jgi:hypothetical protein
VGRWIAWGLPSGLPRVLPCAPTLACLSLSYLVVVGAAIWLPGWPLAWLVRGCGELLLPLYLPRIWASICALWAGTGREMLALLVCLQRDKNVLNICEILFETCAGICIVLGIGQHSAAY